jgi:RNA polymerase sigma-70 factor (ECF subfamily)
MSKENPISERELVEGCVRNDRYFQEQLYRRFFPTMIQMCMRYASDRDEAMLIVNNGFLRVFQKIDTFAFKGSLEGWIRRLVFHSLSDHYKKQPKNVHFLVWEEWDSRDTHNTALPALYLEDLLGMVDQLPPATKDVFCLYAIDGYTHAEIAQRLGMSEGTSKWHLNAARKRLKDLIAQQNLSQSYAG